MCMCMCVGVGLCLCVGWLGLSLGIKKSCVYVVVLEFLLSKCVWFPQPCIFDVGSVCVSLFWC